MILSIDEFNQFAKQWLNHPFLYLWKSITRVWCSITPRWQDLEHHMNAWLILHSFVIVYINGYTNFTLTVTLAANFTSTVVLTTQLLSNETYGKPAHFTYNWAECALFGALAPRLSATYLYFGGLSAFLSFCYYLSFRMVLSQYHVSANLYYLLWIKTWNYICCAGLASAHS